MPELNPFEKILNDKAKENMIQWDIQKFKREYPHLFQTIMASMLEVKSQTLKTNQ